MGELDPRFFDPVDDNDPPQTPGSVRRPPQLPKRKRLRMGQAETEAGAAARPATIKSKPGGKT